ncbi:MAG TPA: hypothetical protein PKO06_11805, partial [Candidatus Ozemobacteraceae bacterium]|nr:hypothetical protein [Candidatus Ozemobacteraceae bacterium]
MPEAGRPTSPGPRTPDPVRAAELRPWLILAAMHWLGATVRAGMITELGSADAALQASPQMLAAIPGIDQRRLDR